jgi:hypothetical protein
MVKRRTFPSFGYADSKEYILADVVGTEEFHHLSDVLTSSPKVIDANFVLNTIKTARVSATVGARISAQSNLQTTIREKSGLFTSEHFKALCEIAGNDRDFNAGIMALQNAEVLVLLRPELADKTLLSVVPRYAALTGREGYEVTMGLQVYDTYVLHRPDLLDHDVMRLTLSLADRHPTYYVKTFSLILCRDILTSRPDLASAYAGRVLNRLAEHSEPQIRKLAKPLGEMVGALLKLRAAVRPVGPKATPTRKDRLEP